MTDAQQIELPEPSPEIKTVLNDHTPLSLPDGSFVVIEGIDGAGKSTALGALAHTLDDNEFVVTTEPDDSTIYGQAVRHAIKDDETHPLAVFLLFLADHANHYHTKVKPALDHGTAVICDRYIDSRYAYQSYALREAVANPEPWLDTLTTHLATSDYPVITVTEDIADAHPTTLFFIALARAFVDNDVLHPAMRPGEHHAHVATELETINNPLAACAHQPREWLETVHDYDSSLPWIQSIQEYESWSRLPDLTLLLDISVDTSLERIGDGPKETFEKRDFLEAVRDNYLELAATEPRFATIDAEQSPANVVEQTLDALGTLD